MSAPSYLVCATQRSGSTLLCEALKATGVAGRPEEFFEARPASGVPPEPLDYLDGIDDPYVTGLLADAPAPPAPLYSALAGLDWDAHLTRSLRDGRTPNGVFGAKVMWNQLADIAELSGRRIDPLALLATTHLVWVRRRDVLRQAVSLWRALQTQAWREAGAPQPTAVYSRAAIAHLTALLTDQDAAWGAFFADRGLAAARARLRGPRGRRARRRGTRARASRRPGAGDRRARPAAAAPVRRHLGRVGGGVPSRHRRAAPQHTAPAVHPGVTVADRPNVIYLHSHDTGRHVQPYGHAVPTPAIQRLAEQGVLFRRAFATAADLLGQPRRPRDRSVPARNGMTGLAHRGWELDDTSHHLVHTLRQAGYFSELIGEQHVSETPDVLGYDRVHEIESNHVATVAPLAVGALEGGLPEPFFLSVGFFETHRGSSSRRRSPTSATRCRPRTCPTSPRSAATWRASWPARARWTTAWARFSPRWSAPGWTSARS